MENMFRSIIQRGGMRGAGLGVGALLVALLVSSAPVSAEPNCCSDARRAPPDYRFNPYGTGGADVLTVSPHGRLSIQQAIEAVKDGGVVRVEPGVYDETLRIRKGVTLQTTAQSTDQTRTVIRPSNLRASCLHALLSGNRPQAVNIRGIDFEMSGARGKPCVHFESQNPAGHFELTNSKVTGDGQTFGNFGNSNGGAVTGGVAVLIDGGTFKIERSTISSGTVGIHVVRSAGAQNDIRYNYVTGNGTGIRAEGGSGVQIASNLVQGNSTGIYAFIEGGRVTGNLVSRNYNTGMQIVYANLANGTLPTDQVTSNNINDNYFGLLLSAAADDQVVRSSAADLVLSDRAIERGQDLATRCSGDTRDSLLCSLMNTTVVNNCIYTNEVGVMTRDHALRRQEIGNNIVYNNRHYGWWGMFKGSARKACERQEYNYGQSITAMLSSFGFW